MTTARQSSLQNIKLYAARILAFEAGCKHFFKVQDSYRKQRAAFSEKQSSDDELSCMLIFQRNQNTLAVRCRRKSSVNTVTVTANPSQGLQGYRKS